MMFSSNQILQISGNLTHKNELKHALQFAIEASGWLEPMTRANNPCKCTYQITKDGKYCIGWGGTGSHGWQEFPFDFDIDITAQINAKQLSKQEIIDEGGDGSYSRGFLMQSFKNMSYEERDKVENVFYGIVSFEPYTCYYSK